MLQRGEMGSWLRRLGPKRVSEARKGEEDVRTSFICVQFRFLKVVDTLEKRKTATDLINSSSHYVFFPSFLTSEMNLPCITRNITCVLAVL